MIQRRSDSQPKIRILSSSAPEAASHPSPRFPTVLPEARFETSGKVDVLVRFKPQAFANLLAHCAESNDHGREICGLLLGTETRIVKDQGKRHLLIVTDILPFETSDASGAHVSANEDVWLWAETEIEKRFKGKERLGWYHTHPTQGIFFSGSDKDFHSVFTKPYQFALVVDPRFPKVGLFHWQDRQAGQIAGPIPLPLRAEPAHLVVPRPTPADIRRLLFLFLGLAGFVAFLVTGRDTGRMLPLAVLFTSALLLRCWNAVTVPDPVHQNWEVRVGPVGRILLFATLLLPFFVAGLRLGTPLPATCVALLREPTARPPATEATITPAAVPSPARETTPAEVETSQPETASSSEQSPAYPVRESRAVRVWVRSWGISLLWDGGSADYALNDKTKLYTLRSGQEDALLGYVLGVNNPWVPERRRLQKALGFANPDGAWGDKSRTALVKSALDRAGSGQTLDVHFEDRILTITFTKSE